MRHRIPALAVVIALVAGGCSVIGGGGGDEMTITVWFERAVSVYPSSEVKVLGLPAGTVTEVEPEGDKVRLTLEIDDGVPIPRDVRAALVPQSLIGERYVQLFPAWTSGEARLESGAVLDTDRTSIPVEQDEALQALKDFLDALDPEGAGRLVRNAADSLEGNGAQLGAALSSIAELNATFADKDDTLVSIFEQLDEFSATLLTRERQLVEILDLFAQVTSTLAEERAAIEGLVAGLAQTSTAGLDLLTGTSVQLRREIEHLTTTMRTVEANLGAVDTLLATADDFPAGLADAYDPEHRRLDLRNNFSPIVGEIGDPVPGVPDGICVPVDVECEVPTDGASTRAGTGVRTSLDPTPQEPAQRDRSVAGRTGRGLAAVRGLLGDAAATLLGLTG